MALDFDIERMFREKNPRLARRIPCAGYALLRRILREREVRHVLKRAGDRQGYELVRFLLDAFGIRVRVEGVCPEKSARWTVCANHPTGGWDALALLAWAERWHPDSQLLVNDVVYSVEPLRSLFCPVDVFARSRKALEPLAQLYASDRTVLIFPAGRTSRPRKGELQEYAWDKLFVRKSRQHDRLILPVHISGQNSNRFYRVWRWRERLGIKGTVEMFLLVDEMIRRRDEEIVLTIGQPREPRALVAECGGDAQAAAVLRQHTQALGRA